MTQNKKNQPMADQSSASEVHFAHLGIAKNLLVILSQKGFDIPTPIQHQIIPGALEGKDVVGIAQTGTGKTLAYGIPMIQRLAVNKRQGLILVPTRELAIQVEEALRAIGTPLGLRTAVVIGGVAQYSQVRAIRNNPHLVIATPGRLDDLMKQNIYHLDEVGIITLDEADRMLDVGFLPQIKRIMQIAPKDRQTMLFSATMPQSISSLASAFMKLPLRIEIAPQGTSAENVEQEVFVVRKNDKMRLLDSLLQKYTDEKVLLFSRTKHGAKRITRDIKNMNHTSTEIHGNRSQPQRQFALEGFKNGRFRVMVATDIAARGIDVRDIGLVINFDLPDTLEDYVHRIGRTGRAGRSGKAISFVTPPEKADIRKIERLIRKSLPILSLPTLPPDRPKAPPEPRREQGHRRSGGGGGYGGHSSGYGGKRRSGGGGSRGARSTSQSSGRDNSRSFIRQNRSRRSSSR
ncbi:DEAD/DEAH box helicase [Patescibacteria group bacterium]|nr:DEAD/DEAH box helicase [Patescibacteria group bacterium]